MKAMRIRRLQRDRSITSFNTVGWYDE